MAKAKRSPVKRKTAGKTSPVESLKSIIAEDIPKEGLLGLSWAAIAMTAAATGVAGLAYTAYKKGNIFGVDLKSILGSRNNMAPKQKFTKITKSSEDYADSL